MPHDLNGGVLDMEMRIFRFGAKKIVSANDKKNSQEVTI